MDGVVLRRDDFIDAVMPGSSEGVSLNVGTFKLVSPMEWRCFKRGLVDRNPIDLRSTSRDIVIALGSAELTLSTGKGVGICTCDVDDECS